MTKTIAVLGPWGSGTSAVVGGLKLLGCYTCPPHYKTYDSRTPNSFESLSLRRIIIPNFNEFDLRFCGKDRSVIPGLLTNWLAQKKQLTDKPIVIKLPHLCFFIPDMVAAWDPIFIMVERPLEAIEASRVRRRWPLHLGAASAKACYGIAHYDLRDLNLNCLMISYDELTKNSGLIIDQIISWVGLSPSAEAKAAAVRWVTR